MEARRSLLIFLLLAVFLPAAFFFGSKFSTPKTQPVAVLGSVEKFEFLAKQRSNICGLQPTSVASYADEARLQGSCCSPMDLHRYQEQVAGLTKYAKFAQIPADPYDIPASLAKELLGYQTSIQLTAGQQAVYDEAMKLSDEGGPCCCRCWRWFTFEGLAKYLITKYDFTASEIAEIWDLEDGCGGGEHAHDEQV